jgi:predicted short-subunit dehydrogenase-like oxidoreductase (DUF2520 family)
MNPNSKSSILIIGGGRAGSSLAYHYLENKIKIIAIVEKDPQRIQFLEDELHWDFIWNHLDSHHLHESEIILLAVQDDTIRSIVKNLAKIPAGWVDKTVLHLAGAVPSNLLHPLRTRGAYTGSLHPLFSFATDPRENLNFQNCWFTLESDRIKPEDLEQKLAIKKDRIIPVNKEQKQAVHIASVFYTNFFIALADMSHEIITKSNVWPSRKLPFIKPLILSTIENLTKLGPAEALTGPLSRGDLGTLRHHLRYLEKNHPDLKEAYQLLGKRLTMLSKMSKKEKQVIIDLLNLS